MRKFIKLIACIFGLTLITSCTTFLPYTDSSSTTTQDNTNTTNTTTNTTTKTIVNVVLPETVNIHTGEHVELSGNTACDVVEAVADSVVEIYVEAIETGYYYGRQYSELVSGAGSGVILDSENGYIITNHHVIDGAETISVLTRSGDAYNATLVASDEESDIAVLNITPDANKPLTHAVIGNSDNLKPAQDILVIGNPLGSLGGSVTKGIVSALDRQIEFDNFVMNLLQIDAAVNPGNSGGALFDMAGQLVGIVNSKYVDDDIDNIGFAIPMNDAIEAFNNLCTKGYIPGRTKTGLYVEESEVYINKNGDYVDAVLMKADDTATGLKNGDQLLKIDDEKIEYIVDIVAYIRTKNVGDSVTITYSRPSLTRVNSGFGRYQQVYIYDQTSTTTVTITLLEDIPSTVEND